jgi:rubredoxin
VAGDVESLHYKCDTCGWVYDPKANDGRPLADQDDWECPECQSGMDHFDVVLPDELGEPEADEQSGEEPADLGIPMSQRKVSAHKADNSVFELSRLEQTGQLVLQPSFQRYYVWTDKQASALVESIFLQLPIPLIYLAEESGGEYAVVDGQQRLTALINYTRNLYELTGLTVLTDLNGNRFSELTKSQQRHIENYLLSVIRIGKESHPEVKFEVFERLNTGSVKLNDQEVRNAVFRGPYNDHLRKLAKNVDFLRLLGQSEPHKRMSDVELVLRYAAWLNQGYLSLTTKQLKAFMNREMEDGRTRSGDQFRDLESEFKKSVDLSKTIFGARAFRRFIAGYDDDPNGQWEMRQPNKALYDVVMFGFSRYKKNQVIRHADAIYEALVSLMSNNYRFVDAITAGTTDPRRVKTRFETWLGTLQDVIGDDPNDRAFSKHWKEQLFASGRTCSLCGNEIKTVDDAHVHHEEHYWRGGVTLPKNSQLVHRFCNLSEGGGKPQDAETAPATA